MRLTAWNTSAAFGALIFCIVGLGMVWMHWQKQSLQAQTQIYQQLLSHQAAIISAQAQQATSEELLVLVKGLSPLLAKTPLSLGHCLYLDGLMMLEVGNKQICPSRFPDTKKIEAELINYATISTADGKQALLLTAANPGYQLQALRATAQALLVVALCLLICSAGLLYFYLHYKRLDTAPLGIVLRYSHKAIKDSDYKWQLPKLAQPFTDVACALNKMSEELLANENLIQELTIQLQEKADQLEAQRKEHLDRNQNLQKMFAGASHDLRQPLQAMVIFLSSIKERARPDQLPHIQKLEQVVDNLNHLFTDLLDLSKLESRMKRIPKQSIAIRPFLAKIHDEFDALAQDKKIEFRLYTRDLFVYSNPNMLERIIRNMISNAIRYTRTGGVLIGSRRRKNEIWIEVWDTGRGIPEDKMNEIFNEFVQIQDKNTDTNKGVGLGLFIVKRLAQLLDHSIIVKSKIKKGTLFRVVVPIALNNESINEAPINNQLNRPDFNQAQALQAKPENQRLASDLATKNLKLSVGSGLVNFIEPEKDSTSSPSPKKVLLVDDDEEIRLGIKHLLVNWGYDTCDLASLDELASLPVEDLETFDLLISDFQLAPGVTGKDVIRHVHENCQKPVPVIIVSGASDPDVLDEIKGTGQRFLKKPIRPAKLRALINVLLDSY